MAPTGQQGTWIRGEVRMHSESAATGTIYRARSPLRLSFAGGGTDVPPYPALRGGAVVSGTINRYAFASLLVRPGSSVRIESMDLGKSVEIYDERDLDFDGTVDLAKAVIRRMGGKAILGKRTFLLLHTEAPPGTGLGSSSAAVVAMLGAFSLWLDRPMEPKDIASLAWSIEREDLRIPGGYQDQSASVYGGFNFIEMDGSSVLVHPIRVSHDFVNELNYGLVLCYVGKGDRHSGIIQDQVDRVQSGVKEALDALDETKALAFQMRNAFTRGDLNAVGSLLDEAWNAKKRFAPGTSTPLLDRIYEGARSAGALGGKVTGAGGGGHMLFYCHPEHRWDLVRFLDSMNLQVVPFSFEPQGLQTWRVDSWELNKKSVTT